MKIIKFLKFHYRMKQNNENLNISYQKHENHEKLIILCQNQENHEFHKVIY